MRVLVIGGAGFLGSVVGAQLADAGHELTVCDNLSTGNAWAVPPSCRFLPVDVTDREALTRVVADGYDAVMHLGGPSLAAEPDRRPLGALRAGLVGVLNVLEAMEAHGVARLVYSSSAAVYGTGVVSPVAEDAPALPDTPQGVWQRTVEQAVGFAATGGTLGAVGLRIFNVAGARGTLGEWHHPETHLIPLVLQAAAGVRPSVSVFGTDYDTDDGTAVRDYAHVEDVARAYRQALAAAARPGHAVYNTGTGAGRSVRQVIDVARQVTGRPILTVEAPRRVGDCAWLVASPERARVELDWSPTRDLAEAVADAWAWMRHRLGDVRARPGSGGR